MKKRTIAGLAALGAVLGAATAAGVVSAKKKKQLELQGNDNKSLPPKRNIYFAGGGLAALSGAYYLIRDCHVPGDSIHIFEESGSVGGAFNVGGDCETGFVCAAPKLLSVKNHANLMDMLDGLKSASLPDMSVKDEITNFMNANPINENARIIDETGNAVMSGFGMSKAAVKRVKILLSEKDYMLSERTIAEFFSETPEFIESNLWILLSSAYMLRTDSSAAELKHILNCVSGEMPELYTMKNTLRAQFNLQDTVIKALVAFLEANNVNFATHCLVNDVDFEPETNRISAIHLNDNGTTKTFYLNAKDLFFVTNGSISECATIGDYNYPAPVSEGLPASAELWRRIAEKRDGFGNPEAFYDTDDSEVITFTITAKSRLILDIINEFTGNTAVCGGLTTFAASPWGMTISNVPQPYFENQTDDITVICGTCANVNAEGRYIEKELRYASGAEILFELVKLIGADERWDEITADIINVIPCAMPYAAASSLPYSDEEKPIIVKDGSNMAFIGQFAKLGAGISYSSEYAVRTAREAAYRLTGTRKSSTPPPKAVMTSYIKLFKALKK